MKDFQHKTEKIRDNLIREEFSMPDINDPKKLIKKGWYTLKVSKSQLLQILRAHYWEDLGELPDGEIGVECEGGISTGENVGMVTDEDPLLLIWEGKKDKKETPEVKEVKKNKRKSNTGKFKDGWGNE